MLPLKKLSWATLKRLIRIQFPAVNHISAADLAKWLEQDSSPLLLDARTLVEYQVSHLPKAQLISEDWLQKCHIQQREECEAKACNAQSIVVYCSVGYRSAKLAAKLQRQGFQQVFNLEGSIFAWANAGYPVYRGTQQVHQVHPYNIIWGTLLNAGLHSP